MRRHRFGANGNRGFALCAAMLWAFALQTDDARAAMDARLTSVKGEATSAVGALDSHAQVADGEALETGDDSGCSILLDENAVVELCGRTRVSFATDPKRGNRIVNIEAGSVRLFVEPRDAHERIEIHTPAAIATILGTIVYVNVDPATGEATFTSSDSRVNVRGGDEKDCTPIGLPAEAGTPQCAAGVTIDRLEQLSVAPGEKPSEKRRISEQDLAMLGGCLLNFHEVAAEIDRMEQEKKATERMVAVDVAAVDLPPVSLEDGPVIETESGEDLEAELDPFDEPGQEELIREMFLVPPVPDCGGGIPGEHCNF